MGCSGKLKLYSKEKKQPPNEGCFFYRKTEYQNLAC
jgi:hypothetical protein